MKLTAFLLAPLALALGAQAADLAADPAADPTITLAECRIACEGGQEIMERFCRIIPHPALRAACWGLAVALDTRAGQTACANWCYWQWGSRKREVIQILEGRAEVSLASDFALTGLELAGEPKAWTA
ncbi:hypothetical protein QBC44DRAFT_401666 [Cladorrhinum sp. PSN332]|nr:hypothetical protein QBC44DRAFT_401666 [Cladorrhinum sp. PSN332]